MSHVHAFPPAGVSRYWYWPCLSKTFCTTTWTLMFLKYSFDGASSVLLLGNASLEPVAADVTLTALQRRCGS